MKPIHALAVLGALAAGPALAQQAQQTSPTGRPDAVIMGVDIPQQAVQPQFLAQIQQQLKSSGHYQGQVDGIFGDQTQAALAAWQRDQGLQPTGQLNAQTLSAMDIGTMSQQEAQIPAQTQSSQPLVEDRELQQQQARQPGDEVQSGDVETLREEGMSAPNVEGENVPERPGLGTPVPGATPQQLEQPQQD